MVFQFVLCLLSPFQLLFAWTTCIATVHQRWMYEETFAAALDEVLATGFDNAMAGSAALHQLAHPNL